MFIIARACAAVNEGGGRKRRPPVRMGRMRGMRRKSQKKGLTNPALLSIISLVPDEHAPIAQLDRAFDYESKGHRFESCWVHHKPLTCFAPLAVFLFVVSKQFFLILLDFLNLTSRSASSISEDAPRLFSLWSRSILVVLIKMGDLAQIMAQNLFRGCRFSLVLPVFFRTSLWHRLGTNRLIPP